MTTTPSSESAWTLRRTGDGSPTLVHPLHGQACHSDTGAWLEARVRFAEPCHLARRAAAEIESGRDRPRIRLLDIGTGPGWNLAAALAAVEGAGGELDAWTFEHDESVLRRTLTVFADETSSTEHARRHLPVRRALAQALDDADTSVAFGQWSRLRLVMGDARTTLEALPPEPCFDAVFLDPFSLRVEPELWSRSFLGEVALRMAPGSWLATYSTSLNVITALAASGLKVGLGPAVGGKPGTLASPDLDPPPLAARTTRKLLRRLERMGFKTAPIGGLQT